nr:MAG: helix-turn-helix domain protein [Bacteriophage sp.]
MSGEEMKRYIKASGVNMKTLAENLKVSPQNLNSKLNAKSLRADFIQKIKEIIDKCAPPLPAEMEEAVFGSNVNGSNSPNVSQSLGSDAALAAENKLLREQNEFLQSQVKTLLAIVGQK